MRAFSSPLGSMTNRSLTPLPPLALSPTSAPTTNGLVETMCAYSMPWESLYEAVGAPVTGSRICACSV